MFAISMAIAVAVGVGLRFVTTSPLWLDEALSVNIAALPLGDIPEALRHDGHPPLYYFLLHGWMEVFGQSDGAVRALSGLFAVVALALVGLAGHRLGGSRLAATAVVVMALSPFALRYATETRMYSLVMVLVLVGYLLVNQALQRPSWALRAGVAVTTGALMLTHYWTFWVIGAAVVLLGWRARRVGPGTERSRVYGVLSAVAAGGLLFVPWLPSFLEQAASTGTPWASPVRPTSVAALTLTDFGGGEIQEAILFGAVLLLIFAVGLFGRSLDDHTLEIDLRTVAQVRVPALLVGLPLALGVLAGWASDTTYAPRFASTVLPFFVLVVAAGLTRFTHPVVFGSAVALVALLGSAGIGANVIWDRTQAGLIAETVEARVAPGDLVVMCPDQLGPAVNRELTDDIAQIVYPTFGSPERVDWVDYAERNAAADPEAFATAIVDRVDPMGAVWLVASGDYRTFEGQCERLHRALSRARPDAELLVGEDGDEFMEHASLRRYPPRP